MVIEFDKTDFIAKNAKGAEKEREVATFEYSIRKSFLFAPFAFFAVKLR